MLLLLLLRPLLLKGAVASRRGPLYEHDETRDAAWRSAAQVRADPH